MRLGWFVTRGARGCFVPIGWFAFVGVVLPDLRFGSVTTPTGFAWSLLGQAAVFGSRGHRWWLSADDPEHGKQREDANGDA